MSNRLPQNLRTFFEIYRSATGLKGQLLVLLIYDCQILVRDNPAHCLWLLEHTTSTGVPDGEPAIWSHHNLLIQVNNIIIKAACILILTYSMSEEYTWYIDNQVTGLLCASIKWWYKTQLNFLAAWILQLCHHSWPNKNRWSKVEVLVPAQEREFFISLITEYSSLHSTSPCVLIFIVYGPLCQRRSAIWVANFRSEDTCSFMSFIIWLPRHWYK